MDASDRLIDVNSSVLLVKALLVPIGFVSVARASFEREHRMGHYDIFVFLLVVMQFVRRIDAKRETTGFIVEKDTGPHEREVIGIFAEPSAQLRLEIFDHRLPRPVDVGTIEHDAEMTRRRMKVKD